MAGLTPLLFGESDDSLRALKSVSLHFELPGKNCSHNLAAFALFLVIVMLVFYHALMDKYNDEKTKRYSMSSV